VEKAEEISRKYNIPLFAYGHAGDGKRNICIHLRQIYEKDKMVNDLLAEIYTAGITLGGAISGEHGVGLDKKSYFSRTVPCEKLSLIKRIKAAFDPENILNPGKIIE
jgi:glycolate oxidase